jgi:4'-phosphopantetheinyl transferase EntD
VHSSAPGDPSGLLAEEAALIDRWAPRRVAEFAAGRTCARLALEAIGVPSTPLLRGEDREPRWPDGVVGSITHTDGYCAAAVAHSTEIASVGIDAEEHDRLPEGVLQRIALPDEEEWIRAHEGGRVHWDRVLFSAKEAVFKTWFPLTRRWLEFEGARIELAPDPSGAEVEDELARGSFTATLLVDPPVVDGRPLERLPGRYLVTPALILAAITVPRES